MMHKPPPTGDYPESDSRQGNIQIGNDASRPSRTTDLHLENRYGGRKGTAVSNGIKTTKFESKNEAVMIV